MKCGLLNLCQEALMRIMIGRLFISRITMNKVCFPPSGCTNEQDVDFIAEEEKIYVLFIRTAGRRKTNFIHCYAANKQSTDHYSLVEMGIFSEINKYGQTGHTHIAKSFLTEVQQSTLHSRYLKKTRVLTLFYKLNQRDTDCRRTSLCLLHSLIRVRCVCVSGKQAHLNSLGDQAHLDISGDNLYARIYFTKHQLDSRQHGFLSGKSCTTQLIPFTHSLVEAYDEKARVDIVYFDFSRAFDSCNHDLILHKLKYQFGVDGQLLSFIKSYLSNRFQKVVLDGESSDVLAVLSGVPQGSILGPILFVIFINDIFLEVNNDTCISLYADDTKVWRRIVYMTDHILLQQTVDNLYNWSVRNLMHFHPAKCHVLSVGNPSLCRSNLFANLPFFNFIYSLGEDELNYVSSQRDLGVAICDNLNFNYHCESILNTMVFKFNLLRRSCFFLKRSCHKRTLYLSMVRSLVEHCNQVWSNLNVGSFKGLLSLRESGGMVEIKKLGETDNRISRAQWWI
eukprot:sb/3463975/